MKLVIDFKKLEYRKPRGAFDIFIDLCFQPLTRIVENIPIHPPLVYRYTSKKGLFSKRREMSYRELGETIYFYDGTANLVLKKHCLRLAVYDKLLAGIYYPLVILPCLAIIYILGFISQPVFNSSSGLAFLFAYIVIIIILAVIAGVFAYKIAVILIARFFADTLALISGLYLSIILEKETSLADPEARRSILSRIHILRKTIVLLSVMSVRENDAWPAAHFKKMEQFVRERERWAIAPQEQTLADLRRDFSAFLEILVTGQYGKFEWEDFEDLQTVPKETEQKPAERIVRLLATILPFVLLIVLFLFPTQVKAIGFDNNIVGLFLLAWLLLAIDASLKLGMVERASAFAKTIKDLG